MQNPPEPRIGDPDEHAEAWGGRDRSYFISLAYLKRTPLVMKPATGKVEKGFQLVPSRVPFVANTVTVSIISRLYVLLERQSVVSLSSHPHPIR